jgi:hypothetical protein
VRTPDLPNGKRITAAKLAGMISRLKTGQAPLEVQLAEVWALTRDPEILGHEMGCRLGMENPTPADAAAVELLRAAGADEEVARHMAEWQRWKWQRRAEGGFTL